ncbi:MAG: xanthine dehydrogenase family protein molybdopterin-binding subunit [Burkholderiales bacterium]|nr:xanthine dehydrogenase family protein molybdopterin-binding subunit [Burkholderiales bacterium]
MATILGKNNSGTAEFSSFGRSIPRLEGRAKVTGRAEYVHNLRLPGMLYGRIYRSMVAHARIRSVDVAAAQAMPGVYAVYTGADMQQLIPEPYYGPAFHDQPILALGKVHYVGEPVALVLAADPHVAEAAAQLIVADYEELPAVFDEVEAMTSTAIVHDVLKPAGTFPDLKHLKGKSGTNVALDFHLRRGEAQQAFAAADHVFEHTFRTQQVLHLPLEPFVTVADPTPGQLVIHTASQSPSFVRIEIARLLGWPENKVRVKVPYLGGGFGAKLYIKLEALTAAAALIAGRPVKIALTMEEQFYTLTKHATTLRIKSGVTRDGRITARECEVWWNGGAYADIGPRITQKSGFTAAGPYDIDHVSIDSYSLYTNLPPAGALRGFGIPQLVWAYESHTDMIAKALGMDPLTLRRRNILREGRPQATGTLMRDAGIEPVLERLAQRMAWEKPFDKEVFDKGRGTIRRGRGIAIGFKASISPTTSMAIVNISADGSCIVYCSTVDMGQGSDTAMAQFAAEALGIPVESVTLVHPDTDVTPYDMATLGSRSTYHMGHAVKNAAEDARDKLLALAQEVGLSMETTPIPDIFRKKYGMQAGNIVGVGSFIPPYTPPEPGSGLTRDATPFWMIGATGAEVEVDTETGEFKVTRLVNLVDVGRPVNPAIVETQISGATIMQLGFTLSERMDFDGGQVTNASLADYKIPGIRDVPPVMENEAVEMVQKSGPFGAKGVGESGTFGVSPAIASAIDDAVGVRLTSLPLTAEAVYRGLCANAGKPLQD